MEATRHAAAPTRELAPTLAKFKGRTAVGTRPIQVLLVEDDESAADLAMLALREDPSDPFQVEWTTNLLGAMQRLAQPGIDVVLLDLGMPELTGYKCFRAIAGVASADIPIVILSADDRMHSRELTLACGASNYLLKGQSTPLELRQALREAVQLT